ncbi:hypothetical protein BpHYR1_044677 [Brachionus plicatilis]|uniref:Uncharacterized protein n=1 Tax=Brachionus plicatilis TaxID=10195 RepID=A0A3M7T2B5_BRAPC|nr:hypothetical protein BpHYR1_044677 [Brachionus plicatilis]
MPESDCCTESMNNTWPSALSLPVVKRILVPLMYQVYMMLAPTFPVASQYHSKSEPTSRTWSSKGTVNVGSISI